MIKQISFRTFFRKNVQSNSSLSFCFWLLNSSNMHVYTVTWIYTETYGATNCYVEDFRPKLWINVSEKVKVHNFWSQVIRCSPLLQYFVARASFRVAEFVFAVVLCCPPGAVQSGPFCRFLLSSLQVRPLTRNFPQNWVQRYEPKTIELKMLNNFIVR